MLKTIDTVEREREIDKTTSREISFLNCAQNTVLTGIRKIKLNNKENKDRLYSNIKVVM